MLIHEILVYYLLLGPFEDDSGTYLESDTEGGSIGYDNDVGEDRDVLGTA